MKMLFDEKIRLFVKDTTDLRKILIYAFVA